MRDTCGWKLDGAETMRASSSKLLGIWGGNRQNVSDDLRRHRIADPGKVLIQRDQSGAEALIVSRLTYPGKFRSVFDAGIKIHSYLAMIVNQNIWEDLLKMELRDYISSPIPDLMKLPRAKELFKLIKSSDDWEPSRRYYFINKKLCHQSNYGGSANRFALSVVTESEGQVKITLKEAERLLNCYHNLFPEIKMWHRDIEREYECHHMLYNLFGFPWKIDKPKTDSLLRKLYAFKPQSTVGVITHRAITAMQDYIEENKKDWDLLNNCHDSMLWQCPEDKEEIRESILVSEKFMNQELVSPRGEKFTMKSEAAIGYNWGHHKECNPQGLGCLPVENYLN